MYIEKQYFSGLKKLGRDLTKITNKQFRKKALMDSGRVAMRQMLADAIINAPILSAENIPKNKNINSGELKGDIKYVGKYNNYPKYKKSKPTKLQPLNAYEWVGRIKTNKMSEEYVLPIEYGRTSYTVMRIYAFGRLVSPFKQTLHAIEANPFMRKALDDNKDNAISTYMAELSRQILLQTKKIRVNKRKALKNK